jgi:sec-independent protein translocase protein TatB
MNVFSNLGVTELILILLLALLVVGPERLPEMGRKLGKLLRDLRKMYENLTKDLGPEIQAMQQPIQELRQSVDAIRSIPQEMVQTVVKASDLDATMQDLKQVQGTVAEASKTLSDAGRAVANPVGAAMGALKPQSPASAGGAPAAAARPDEPGQVTALGQGSSAGSEAAPETDGEASPVAPAHPAEQEGGGSHE